MAKFSPIWDFPEYFWYDDLTTALRDLRLSGRGIGEITAMRPLTDASDREAFPAIMARMALDLAKQASGNPYSLALENVQKYLLLLGFTEEGVKAIYRRDQLTVPKDRGLLVTLLTRWLVRNKDHVTPEFGDRGDLTQMWKVKQLEKHRQETPSN